MKSGRIKWTVMFLGIFLILAGVLTCKSIDEESMNLYGRYGMQKVVINLKNNIVKQNNDVFSIREALKVKEVLGNVDMTYYSSTETTVMGNDKFIESEVIGTTNNYLKFCGLDMVEGSFFSNEPADTTRYVAVIDDILARKLFGSENILGKKIKVSGKSYTIVGVFSNSRSLLGGLIDNGKRRIYMPIESMFDSYSDASITHLEIKNQNDDTLGRNAETAAKALRTVGKDPADFNIIDFNIKKALILQKQKIAIFIPGIFSIVILFYFMKRVLAEFTNTIRFQARYNYLSLVLRSNLLQLVVLAIKVVSIAFAIMFLWQFISFRLYIPPEYIPAELTDIGYFFRMFQEGIIKSNESRGYIASYPELVLKASQTITNGSFYLCLIPGFLIFYSGTHVKTRILTLLSGGGIFMAAALAVLSGLYCITGLHMVTDLKTISIIWIFIFISILKYGFKERKVVQNV